MKKWLKAAGIRAVRTFAQTLAASVTIGAAANEIDWIRGLSVAIAAGICSLLTSVAGLPELECEREEDKNA